MKFFVRLNLWHFVLVLIRRRVQILVLWLFDSTTMALSMQAVYIFAVARRNLTFATIDVPE